MRKNTYLSHDISPDVLTPEDIAKPYRARYDIEFVFEELKSRYDLDVVNTTKPQPNM
jgi:IS4 transposase